jgi:hypothetical protein
VWNNEYAKDNLTTFLLQCYYADAYVLTPSAARGLLAFVEEEPWCDQPRATLSFDRN